MAQKARNIIIGLDGVPFNLVDNFAKDGVMPNMAKLIDGGVFTKLKSSIPEISSVAWSSAITGKNPGEHGIFGFIDLFPETYKMRFPNFASIQAKAFWEEIPGPHVIINVPSTYPVREMDGLHISGFVSIDMNKSVHPASEIDRLNDFDYRLDVDSEKAHQSMELFLSDLDKTLTARIKTYRHYWDAIDWKTFMLVFTGTDRLMHFLWDAYEDPQHKYHQQFKDHFARIDEVIGEISAKLNDDDVLLLHSDHGFEKLDADVYVNYLLAENNMLSFQPGQTPGLNAICPGTKAFALDPARIYINRKGKYPQGSVEEADVEKITQAIINLFEGLTIDGKKVIKTIHRRDDVYSGPYRKQGPDLVLMAEQGFNLKAVMRAPQLYEKGIFTGKHTYDTAFLAIHQLKNKQDCPPDPSVMDIRSILENRK